VAAPLSDQLEVAPGFELSIGNFEGPFDLLLNLISRHQLDITEVALSRVTEEFIKYVRQLEAIDELEQASEFLVIAATLLDLKIASLLPKGEVVDPEDVALFEARDLLFARLLQYRAFKEISSWFATAMAIEARRIPREVRLEERFKNRKPELIWNTTLAEFAKVAEDALTPREIPAVGLTHLHAPRVSIREQAAEVVRLLRESKNLTFRELIGGLTDRAQVVARFLAVLELYRLAALSFEQDSPLGDVQLTWRAEEFSNEQLNALGVEYDA
jgi:segregation and condensation protein A